MKRIAAVVGTAALGAGMTMAAPSNPASATVATGVSGTIITVDVTGDDTIHFSCVSGTTRVNGAVTSPAVSCASLSGVKVFGDVGSQTIWGSDLNIGFPTLVSTLLSPGPGNDVVYGSRKFDSIDAGAGDDAVAVHTDDEADSTIVLGNSANDSLYVLGTSGVDTVTAFSPGSGGAVTTKVGSAPAIQRDYTGGNGGLDIHGGAGNDVLDLSGLAVTTAFNGVTILGEAGDDTIKTAQIFTQANGGTGANTFVGTNGTDYIDSASETDTINVGGGTNSISDVDSLRSGGRTIIDPTGTATYDNDLRRGDAVYRIRQGSSATQTKATASLNRPGIQLLPGGINRAVVAFDSGAEPADHTLADVVAQSGKDIYVGGGADKTTVVDITVATGSWNTNGIIGNGSGTVTPTAPGLGLIVLTNVGPVSVHGPWASKNRGFGHRAIRDLLFRIAGSTELGDIQGDLDGGVIKRPNITANLMDTDEYRGLDVDRVFVKYLRRKADAGGRIYWINSLDNGKALWRFRAQLFGSNEYFSKAGGTNATYVEQAYTDVLGRAPDPSGKAYWTNKLNNGADRGSVALQFINSPESRRRLVDDQFLRFLDRKPSTAEQDTWVAAIPGATGEQDLIAYLVNSSSYYDRT